MRKQPLASAWAGGISPNCFAQVSPKHAMLAETILNANAENIAHHNGLEFPNTAIALLLDDVNILGGRF